MSSFRHVVVFVIVFLSIILVGIFILILILSEVNAIGTQFNIGFNICSENRFVLGILLNQ